MRNILKILVLFIIMVGTACSPQNETMQETKTETTTSSSTGENQTKQEATVLRVVDGDTLSVSIEGKKETIRLLLIDTPETKHPDLPVQPFGPEASQYAKELLTNEEVMLEWGTTKRDKYDRLLAYVYIDGTLYNKEIIEQGLARVAYVYPPNDKYVDTLRDAEQQAKKKKKGIWSLEGYVTEDGFNSEMTIKKSPTPSKNNSTESNNLLYDPNGADRDCGDFCKQSQAQAFFEAAGGPSKDPHRLDRDGDGVVCETLP